MLSGSMSVKAALKTLVKSTPDCDESLTSTHWNKYFYYRALNQSEFHHLHLQKYNSILKKCEFTDLWLLVYKKNYIGCHINCDSLAHIICLHPQTVEDMCHHVHLKPIEWNLNVSKVKFYRIFLNGKKGNIPDKVLLKHLKEFMLTK